MENNQDVTRGLIFDNLKDKYKTKLQDTYVNFNGIHNSYDFGEFVIFSGDEYDDYRTLSSPIYVSSKESGEYPYFIGIIVDFIKSFNRFQYQILILDDDFNPVNTIAWVDERLVESLSHDIQKGLRIIEKYKNL